MALLIGIISLILNIVIYPLCKIRYRDEDADLSVKSIQIERQKLSNKKT